MGWKYKSKKILEAMTGLKIFRKLPFGFDPFDDLDKCLPGYKFENIFDVGANVGQSALKLSSIYPNSIIYCFEPIGSTFKTLEKNLKSKRNTKCFQIGFAEKPGTLEIKINTDQSVSSMHSLIAENNEVHQGTFRKETIQLETVDSFCEAQGIDHINFLKIDTEGYDFKVLQGAKRMLENGAIDLIEAEVSMNPNNNFHVHFTEIKAYLEANGYVTFGIYEQVQEWLRKKAILRRVNVLFIRNQLAEEASQLKPVVVI